MINKVNVNGQAYDINDSRLSSTDITNIGKINATDIAAMLDGANYIPSAADSNSDTTYKLTINGTTAGDSTNGINLGSVYAPTTAGNAYLIIKNDSNGVPLWADGINYYAVNYQTISFDNNGNNIAFNLPNTSDSHYSALYIVNTEVNITGFTFSYDKLWNIGLSLHLIIKSSSSKTVTLNNVSTGQVRLIWPDGKNPATMTIPAGGYVEIDVLRGADTTENGNPVAWLYFKGQ